MGEQHTVWTKPTVSKLGTALVPFARVTLVAAELKIASAQTAIAAVFLGGAAEAEFTAAAGGAQLCFAALLGLDWDDGSE
jgi:hypothetical protein